MAIIIDFTGKEEPKETPKPRPATDDKPLTLDTKPTWERCKHGRSEVSEEKRTVTCKDCGAAVDPIAYILLLYGHYQWRIDNRLAEIREFERREKDSAVKKGLRESQPRRHRIHRRAETAERAAYNEYQAKLLMARAERQRQLVGRLDAEIASLPPDEAVEQARAVDAVDPVDHST